MAQVAFLDGKQQRGMGFSGLCFFSFLAGFNGLFFHLVKEKIMHDGLNV